MSDKRYALTITYSKREDYDKIVSHIDSVKDTYMKRATYIKCLIDKDMKNSVNLYNV
jgi:hypothetical protein